MLKCTVPKKLEDRQPLFSDEDYISTRQVASLLGISEARVRQLCQEQKIIGAKRTGASTFRDDWLIPRNFQLDDLEDRLWKVATKLRGHISSQDYKEIVLPLLFIKYFSEIEDMQGSDIMLKWKEIVKSPQNKNITEEIDNILEGLKNMYPGLSEVSFRIKSIDLDNSLLHDLILSFDTIKFSNDKSVTKDLIGRVYEYFLSKFAQSDGKRGGEFYTPTSIVKIIIDTLQPSTGSVYDPACGTGGMFVQTEKFVAGKLDNQNPITIYGQELNERTWSLAKLNLFLHGLDSSNIRRGNTLINDLHEGEKFEYIMANPPFNQKDWGLGLLAKEHKWEYISPPSGNANYAWLQSIIGHMSDTGRAAIVLANGSLSGAGAEREIRKMMVKDNVIECVVALPSKLFFSTTIPVSIWFFSKRKSKNEILLLDAQELFTEIDKSHNIMSEEQINRITGAITEWRGCGDEEYVDVSGFSSSINLKILEENNFSLNPGTYVGMIESEKIYSAEEANELISEIEGDFERLIGEYTDFISIIKQEVENGK